MSPLALAWDGWEEAESRYLTPMDSPSTLETKGHACCFLRHPELDDMPYCWVPDEPPTA